jgi:hypothetical protein
MYWISLRYKDGSSEILLSVAHLTDNVHNSLVVVQPGGDIQRIQLSAIETIYCYGRDRMNVNI